MYGYCPHCDAPVYERTRDILGTKDTCSGADKHRYDCELTRATPMISPLGPGVIHIVCRPEQISVEVDGKITRLDPDYFERRRENL